MGEVGPVGVLFPTNGTTWRRGQLEARDRPSSPKGTLPSPALKAKQSRKPPPILLASPLQFWQQTPGRGWVQEVRGQTRGWQWAWPSRHWHSWQGSRGCEKRSPSKNTCFSRTQSAVGSGVGRMGAQRQRKEQADSPSRLESRATAEVPLGSCPHGGRGGGGAVYTRKGISVSTRACAYVCSPFTCRQMCVPLRVKS